jgi:uncharacterized membrane protein
MEMHTRTILRMITYRILAILITIFITWYFTGILKGAIWYSIVLNFWLSVVYYFHERFWLKIKFGKHQ